MIGFVSLVGAGPGDPDLLTRRAIQRLEEADLVFYDALVSPEALSLASRAQRFCVGKRAGRQSISQERIHHLLIAAARRGKQVVRLKCGDPFVLGRGGEEAVALTAAGIPFEVVPGVSAAIAAPALAGIPVTHRGLASGFVVVSGHAESSYRPLLDTLPPGGATLVVLMGLGSRGPLTALLLERGWAKATPAAVVLDASRESAYTWVGVLGDLPDARFDEHPEAAGTIVVGAVVGLRSVLAQSGTIAEAGSEPVQKESYGSR
jgi:uroporphyrin-III C-methyltransferase/precorrin-2 dehydrogenase/sirohydrochlorin ferrochelatase